MGASQHNLTSSNSTEAEEQWLLCYSFLGQIYPSLDQFNFKLLLLIMDVFISLASSQIASYITRHYFCQTKIKITSWILWKEECSNFGLIGFPLSPVCTLISGGQSLPMIKPASCLLIRPRWDSFTAALSLFTTIADWWSLWMDEQPSMIVNFIPR